MATERKSIGGQPALLATGHATFHWILQSFAVVLPEVQAAIGLNSVGAAGIMSARELASGLIALPGGVVVDVLRRYWGLLLAGCVGLGGIGSLALGISPIYGLLLIGIGIVAASHSIWHLAACGIPVAPLRGAQRHSPGNSRRRWRHRRRCGPACDRGAAGIPQLARTAEHLRRTALLPGFRRALGNSQHRAR